MGLRDGTASSGRYEVLAPLGEGGFGAVFEARDTRTGQRVALKELRDSSGQSIARFKQEFRALSEVHHPNLVSLKELIERDGVWLIVMELVEGTDLREYVSGSANDNAFSFDEGRLRRALFGMVEGLSALHAHGILHRDLKPSNVRVTPDGRAVLLDFGLATSIDPQRQSTHALALGTVPYMAPEQAIGHALGPEADLYALGVCLFECLTGRLPIEAGTTLELVLKKQRDVAPRASSIARNVPADLDALCARLLATQPSERPSAAEVKMQLGGVARTSLRPSLPAESTLHGEGAFAGREVELKRLQRALSETHEGKLRIVLVEGESGVGKSELVAELLRRARAADAQLLKLNGRCYENEQVSYKAFDGCIDELARALRKLSREECAALLPVRAAVLAQVFPVLREVKAIAQATREGISADPTARRLEAFEALSRLLSRLSVDRTVVLVVDDLQWADAESFRLLKALKDASESPPILLVATIRPRGELEPDVLTQVLEMRQWSNTSVIELSGLLEGEAYALARRLLTREVPESWLATIVQESEGHPLFLAELVRFAETRDVTTHAHLTLEQALSARIERLAPRERALLEMVAVAARPHGSHVFAHALSVPNVDDASRTLLAMRLLRLRKGQELSCFHDRIRHAMVTLTPHARLPHLHRRLAMALEGTGEVDESEQARHWDLCGEPERAIESYDRAANEALSTLAFVRAEQLCARALQLIESPADPRGQALTIRRAHTLACLGQSGQAATLYDRAAECAHGDERILLRSQAAQHLVLSSSIATGLSQSIDVLADLGFRFPRRSLSILMRFMWEVFLLLLQKSVPVRGRDPRVNFILRAASDLMFMFGTVEPQAYALLILQTVRRAARSGSQVDRAFAQLWQAWIRALNGSLESAVPEIRAARAIIQEHGDPPERAAQLLAEGSAYMAGLDNAKALSPLVEAERILREQCPERTWPLLTVRYHLGGTWYNLGEHVRLAEATETWIKEARERNDLLAVGLLSGMGYGFARHLMADAPQAAIDELAEPISRIPPEPYNFLYLGYLFGTVFALTYAGGSDALLFLSRQLRAHGRAYLLRTGVARVVIAILRGKALRAAALVSVDERARYLKQARRIAEKLRRNRSPFVRATGEMDLAELSAFDGNRAQALVHARTACELFDGVRHGSVRAARYLLGVLEGGESGRAICAAALSELSAEGWRAPRRQVVMLVPLLPLLEPTTTRPARGRLLCDRYEISDALGGGGSGSVMQALDTRTGRQVALKELMQRDGVALERFKREFRTLQEVEHENLVRIDALFEHAGRWYIAMELVAGESFLDYVRPGGVCDSARLRSALLGLIDGLSTLHDAGFVHRDVTPRNLRVTPEGRAVLLDFGLVARMHDEEESGGIGTPEHAAPEQLEGSAPAPQADVYALGSCLYQALTGRPPFESAVPIELVAIKRGALAPPLAGVIDADLAACCRDMLSPRPTARPTLRSIREILQKGGVPAAASVPASEIVDERDEVSFAGREQELSALSCAFVAAGERGLTIVLVEGESGLGKSALVDELARRVAENDPRVRALKSRCYENEQVALKAFDGAVDGLARLLRGLARPVVEALLPKQAALLAQLFPVLTSVPAIANASKKGLPADPAARQLLARASFVALLRNLSAQFSLLFMVDDLQWADGDSLRLFRTLLEHEDELPLLFVCTTRPESELTETAAAETISALGTLRQTTVLRLEGLSQADAEALADECYGAALPAETRARIVRESRGHPLFLRELVEQERLGLEGGPRALTLDDALRARVAHFPREAQQLLALTALASKPLGSHVYARALGQGALARSVVTALLGSGMLRRRGEQELTCYHDRIRRVVVARLSPDERRQLAEQLARAMSVEPSAEWAELARLWDEAACREEAIAAYERAGDHALEKLAFARAEQHYARALALLGDTKDERWRRLLTQRGHALVRAGRFAEAARLFQQASEGAEGELAVRLRIWAAQHLIQSAHIEEGLRVATTLLDELGEPMPRTERAALLRAIWERTMIELRGGKLSTTARSISAHDRLTLEALHALTTPMTAIAPITGMVTSLRFLRHALAAGEAELTARALAERAMWRVVGKPRLDQTHEFERSRTMADAAGNPELRAHVEACWGVACMQNQLRAAPMHLAIAHELLQTRCPGEPWALTQTRTNLGAAWMYAADFRSIARETGGWIDEARERDDRYALAALTGFGGGGLRHIVAGRPEDAIAEIHHAMEPWPAAYFSVLHFGAFCVTALARVAAADPTMFDWLERENDALCRPLLMRAPTCQLALHLMRVNALLATKEARAQPGSPDVLAQLRKEARILARNQSQPADGNAKLVQAVLHALAGRRERALADARAAHELLRLSSHFNLRGAAYLVGHLEGGDEGRAACASVMSSFRDEGFVEPLMGLAMCFPGAYLFA